MVITLSSFSFHTSFVHPFLLSHKLCPSLSPFTQALSIPFSFHTSFVHPFLLSHKLCPSPAGCSPPSMPSIVICCFSVPGGSLLLAMSPCHLLLGRPLDLFPLLGCHSIQRLVHILSFILAMCLEHLHFCFNVHSIMSNIFVLFLISYYGILSCSFRFNNFPLCCCLSNSQFVCHLFIESPSDSTTWRYSLYGYNTA